MNSKERAILLLQNILEVEKMAASFTLQDYAVEKNRIYLQAECTKVFVWVFSTMYGDGDEAAANVEQLIQIKQLKDDVIEPERLQMFVKEMLPIIRDKIELSLRQIDDYDNRRGKYANYTDEDEERDNNASDNVFTPIMN